MKNNQKNLFSIGEIAKSIGITRKIILAKVASHTSISIVRLRTKKYEKLLTFCLTAKKHIIRCSVTLSTKFRKAIQTVTLAQPKPQECIFPHQIRDLMLLPVTKLLHQNLKIRIIRLNARFQSSSTQLFLFVYK